MHDIFLSYANADLSRVRPFIRALEQRGWSVWWDRDIPPGEVYDQVIEKALDAARCVVVVWSQISVTSHWVRTEAEEGRSRNILVPVVIDDNVRIPLAFRLIQAARLIGWQETVPHTEFNRLIQAVMRHIGPPPLQDVQAASLAMPPGPQPLPLRTPPESLTDKFGIEFALLPDGEFLMGSNDGADRERPVHRVQISQPFYLGKYPATQGQWEAVMGNNPSHFTGDPTRPVEQVSWEDVQTFIQRLNTQEGRIYYRLPTEAEWEYAVRAGSTTAYSFGDDAADLHTYAWYSETADDMTHPVGQLQPNAWGLYDMHGNVWEWVQDWYGTYPAEAVTDPQGPPSGSGRVIRGGSWITGAGDCRSAYRDHFAPGFRDRNLGFRLVRTAR